MLCTKTWHLQQSEHPAISSPASQNFCQETAVPRFQGRESATHCVSFPAAGPKSRMLRKASGYNSHHLHKKTYHCVNNHQQNIKIKVGEATSIQYQYTLVYSAMFNHFILVSFKFQLLAATGTLRISTLAGRCSSLNLGDFWKFPTGGNPMVGGFPPALKEDFARNPGRAWQHCDLQVFYIHYLFRLLAGTHKG